MLVSCSNMGARVTDADKREFSKSPNYDNNKGVFINQLDPVNDKIKDSGNIIDQVLEYLFGGIDTNPDQKIPDVKPDMSYFLEESPFLKVIWLGHSTILLNIDGTTILIDPHFGPSVSPVSFLFRRFQDTALSLEELPKIDIILISHDHFDHLDMKSIKHFQNRDVTFLVPLGVGVHLRRWGVSDENIIERDWWESAEVKDITFTSTPSKHASGRYGARLNETQWASWAIQGEEHNLYFSGDSGYAKHFKEIGNRLGPFDIAFIESGQYDLDLRAKHLMPEDGIQAFKDLNARAYFPIHWGMFQLTFHAWYDPAAQLHRLAADNNITLLAPRLGEILVFEEMKPLEDWWTPFISREWRKKHDIQ